MKTVSHIIQLATPSILAFKTSQCFETEDEIFVQTASIVFLQYDEPAKTIGSKFSFRTIMSVPVDEHGLYDECFTNDYFVLLGKAGDTISRYDNRLLSLTYGWKKSLEKPGFTELEAALMKKGINIDTDNIPESLELTIAFRKEDDCFSFESLHWNNFNGKKCIGFKYYELFGDISDKDGNFLPDYRFDNEDFAIEIARRIKEIANCIPVPEIHIHLGFCVEAAKQIPGLNQQEIIDTLKSQAEALNFNIFEH